MSEKKESREYEKLLRGKAEKYLCGEKLLHKQIDEMSEKEIKTTFEELEVHKIELEMQNEELKIAQEQLEKSKQRYFDLYNFAPVGYLTIDNKGSITELNLTASSILKENRSSFIKKSLSKFIASEYEDAYYFFRNKILDLGETQSCDIQMLKKNGEVFWAHLVGKLVGEATINIVFSDISELKKLQEEMTRKDETMIAQSRQAAMGEMIFMIAHQWRQPLNVVSILVNSVKLSMEIGEKVSDEELRTCVDSVSLQAQKLSTTIDNFVTFFKPTNKNDATTIEDVFEATFSSIGESLQSNGVSLNVQNSVKKPLRLDKGSLIQVLLSLVSNAKEALLQRNTIQPTIDVNASETDETITISVRDNAGGMEKSIMNKLGLPYFSTKKELNGTGLGLYIAKTIVEKHLLGELKWRNETKGACFEIILKRD